MFLAETDTTELLAQRSTIKAKLDNAADMFSDDLIDAAQLQRITASERAKLQAVEEELDSLTVDTDLADLATKDIAERWEEIPIERRRALVRLLLTVTILPKNLTKNPRVFDESTVAVEWKR
jgi:hypothetical protein